METMETFDSKPSETPPMTFTGLHISSSKSHYELSQRNYVEKLGLLQNDTTFEMFCSMRTKLAWVVNSRPDIACAVSFASQITPSTFTSESFKSLNKIIKHLKSTADLSLKYPRFDLDTIHITVYSDSSFNNNSDHTSQLRYVILLMDGNNRCCIIQYSSHKSRRVVRSSAAGETIALADEFDQSFILKYDIERMLWKRGITPDAH